MAQPEVQIISLSEGPDCDERNMRTIRHRLGSGWVLIRLTRSQAFFEWRGLGGESRLEDYKLGSKW